MLNDLLLFPANAMTIVLVCVVRACSWSTKGRMEEQTERETGDNFPLTSPVLREKLNAHPPGDEEQLSAPSRTSESALRRRVSGREGEKRAKVEVDGAVGCDLERRWGWLYELQEEDVLVQESSRVLYEI
jgi:hypothetical protein